MPSGSECTPSCNTDYTLSGTASCYTGTLTAAQCIANGCTVFAAPPHGSLGDCSSLKDGAACTPTCDSGYVLHGVSANCSFGNVSMPSCIANPSKPVSGSSPTAHSSATAYTQKYATITFSGGVGLNRQPGADAVKAITAGGSCSADPPAGGSEEDINLGPDDMNNVASATARLRWTAYGSFRLCYKRYGSSWEAVGQAFTVKQSNDATLASLGFNDAHHTIVLTPTFSPTKTGYSVTVPNKVATVTPLAVPTHTAATVQGIFFFLSVM